MRSICEHCQRLAVSSLSLSKGSENPPDYRKVKTLFQREHSEIMLEFH